MSIKLEIDEYVSIGAVANGWVVQLGGVQDAENDKTLLYCTAHFFPDVEGAVACARTHLNTVRGLLSSVEDERYREPPKGMDL